MTSSWTATSLGRAERLSPDAPVPVVDVEQVRDSPGAAGLTALLCLADDIEVTLVAPVAGDRDGERLAELLTGAGVRVVPLPHAGSTRRKTRVRCAGQSLLRLDDGGRAPLAPTCPPAPYAAPEAADVVLVADYGGGTTAHPRLRERPEPACPRGARSSGTRTRAAPTRPPAAPWSPRTSPRRAPPPPTTPARPTLARRRARPPLGRPGGRRHRRRDRGLAVHVGRRAALRRRPGGRGRRPLRGG